MAYILRGSTVMTPEREGVKVSALPVVPVQWIPAVPSVRILHSASARLSAPPLLPESKPRRSRRPEVRISLETNARVKNRFGQDVFARILRMRLRGATTAEIARSIGCSRDLVEDQVRLWDMQIEIACAEMPIQNSHQ